jgi:hypothetical protein
MKKRNSIFEINHKLQEEQATTASRSMMQVILLPFNIAKYFVPRSLRGRQKPMLQPAINSEDDDDNRLSGEFLQQEILSGSLQKY